MSTRRQPFEGRRLGDCAGHRPRLETLEPRRLLDAATPVPMLQTTAAEFVENLGQWDSEIHYLYRTRGANVAFTEQGLSFVGFRPGAEEADILAEAVNMRFDGAQAVAPIGLDVARARYNYHVGSDASAWVDRARAFGTVAYEGLYDGVDLQVSGGSSNLKYEYHVAAGADPGNILVRYDGAEDVYLDDSGALHVDLGDGELIDDAPISYQEINGVRVAVDSAFVIADDGAVGFALGEYDPTADLVIDPSVAWGAYIGGSSWENAEAVALDAYRCVYAVGFTSSAGWVSGGFDTTYGGNNDAFVIKYTRKGVRLWSTYLGGDEYDIARGVTVSDGDCVYVVGRTDAGGWAAGGVGDHTHNGSQDAFVARLRRTGGHVWSCYLGGGGNDAAFDVACSSNEAVHIAGRTYSSGWITKGFDTTYGGSGDGYYARLWVNGKTLRGGYLGGSDYDVAWSVAVDGRNDVLLAGHTASTGWVTKGKDTTLGGAQDGFLTKVAAGGRRIWSRYVGGDEQDDIMGVAIGANNKIYVTGTTYSASWASGGWDTTYSSTGDAFVYAMKTTGQHLWSTYLGGTGLDYGADITADARGDVWAVGFTTSAGWAVGGWDTTANNGEDGYLARFTAMGTHLWSSYMGDNLDERANAVAPDTFNGVHVVGGTKSSGWLTGGFDTTIGGLQDAFTLWAKR